MKKLPLLKELFKQLDENGTLNLQEDEMISFYYDDIKYKEMNILYNDLLSLYNKHRGVGSDLTFYY